MAVSTGDSTAVPPEQHLGRAAARGGLWGVGAETSARASQAICFFVLAGVLSPAEFGAAAVAFVLIQIINSVTYAGLGAAVIVLGRDERRDRTAVGASLLSGLVAAAVLVALADPLTRLLGTPDAVNLVRLVAIALPLVQTSDVLSSLLERELRFRATGVAVVTASVVSAAVGLTLAFTDAGPAALIAQGIAQPGVRLLVLVLARPAALRMALHRSSLGELWATGRELLAAQFFGTAASNVDSIAVSALAGGAALGGYGFAFNLATLPYFLVGLAASRVALPVYGALHARGESVRPAFLTAVGVTSALAALPLGLLAVAGPEALLVIFGDKWDPVADALRLLALYSWLRTVEQTAASLLIATGQAAVMRRAQQLQLAVLLALLVPLVLLDGPFGAAVAVVAAVVLATTYSMRRATREVDAPIAPVLLRLLVSATAGLVGGAAGLLALRSVGGGLGLGLALLGAAGAWAVAMTVLSPHQTAAGWRTWRARTTPAAHEVHDG